VVRPQPNDTRGYNDDQENQQEVNLSVTVRGNGVCFTFDNASLECSVANFVIFSVEPTNTFVPYDVIYADQQRSQRLVECPFEMESVSL
jgi:hypothetical protein